MIVSGWDVGGAHLKTARVEDGRVTAAVEIACPLWQGFEELDVAFATARAALGDAPLSAVTMTGELCDIFATRAEGVAEIAAKMSSLLTGEVRFYGGNEGWLDVEQAAAKADAVASANWHATASQAARAHRDALFVDMGSTTTDIVPILGGKVAARGMSDAARLRTGELVYAGAVRSYPMAVAQRVPFRGEWVPVMGEYFASMGDAYRVLRKLPEGVDLHPTADKRDKTEAASAARLARMIARDAVEAEDWELRSLAGYFAEVQLRALHDGALQVLSVSRLPADAPVVAAGVGGFVVERLAERLGRPFRPWHADIPSASGMAAEINASAPAVAVALLLAADPAEPNTTPSS